MMRGDRLRQLRARSGRSTTPSCAELPHRLYYFGDRNLRGLGARGLRSQLPLLCAIGNLTLEDNGHIDRGFLAPRLRRSQIDAADKGGISGLLARTNLSQTILVSSQLVKESDLYRRHREPCPFAGSCTPS